MYVEKNVVDGERGSVMRYGGEGEDSRSIGLTGTLTPYGVQRERESAKLNQFS